MSELDFATLSAAEVLQKLQANSQGLLSEEVISRQNKWGQNLLPAQHDSVWQIVFRQINSPFVYLLIFAALVALLLKETTDAIMIAFFVILNTFIGFFQEFHSEQTLQLLSKFIESKVSVVRDGQLQLCDVASLVPGDRVKIEPGMRVPADLRLLVSDGLLVDESILTGESIQVEKLAQSLKQRPKSLNEAKNLLFVGSSVLSGSAEAVVIATGSQTSYSKIAQLALQTPRQSLFAKEMTRFSHFTLFTVGVTLAGLVALSLALKTTPTFFELLLFAIALAVSVIPEALPVVTTFCLSIGAKKLAKHDVVVKRLSAIEDLGNIEVLCCDKTGTLTENRLQVTDQLALAQSQPIFAAYLVGKTEQVQLNQSNLAFDQALSAALSSQEKALAKSYQWVKSYPFDPNRRRSAVLLQCGEALHFIVRGSPENILALCTQLSTKEREWIQKQILQKGQEGHRVLAVAEKVQKLSKQQVTLPIEEWEQQLHFSGLVFFSDPIKTSTPSALQKAQKLGIEIKILTGDSPEVAGFVAKQVGLIKNNEEICTGLMFAEADEITKQQLAVKYRVFARVSPEQKYHLLELLQQKFAVGFLGEGINDAPALKIAHVALVVNNASDIAKDEADIVLLQKSLAVIIEGIRQGRTVFTNTSKYITATLSANFGNFFAMAIASLLLKELPMLPLQILLVNLLTDLPMIAIATDQVSPQDLNHPRHLQMGEFARTALLFGIISTLFDFIFFIVFQNNVSILQTAWFVGSVLTELVFVFSIRSRHFFFQAHAPSLFLTGLSILAAIVAIGLPLWTPGQVLFKFIPLTAIVWLQIFVIVIGYFFTTEAVKFLYYSKVSRKEGSEKKSAF